ncbi:MAG TPA: amino acid permease [Thermoanaerobaculia bacterium]|nr:amino acid permease [Thermoanaerobaculia bacterium]
MSASVPGQPPALLRQLRLLDAVGIGFGAIIGAGIFVVTGVAATMAGPALVVALLLAALAATLNALSSAELAARFPQSGGTYEYGYQLLGPWRGFAAGWMFLASKMAAAGVVAIGLGAYATMLVPGINPRALAVVAVVAFTALNYFGIQRTSRLNLLIVGMSITSLLLLVILGAASFRPANFHPFAPGGLAGIMEAAAILFFAYTGYARIATLGEEVRDPRHTIPRAIIITILSSAALYMAVAAVAIGVVGADRIAGNPAPLGVAALAAGGPALATIIAVGAVTAMLGVILSQIIGMSRMAFAMARRSDLPAPLAAVHPRYGVPHRAVLLVGLGAAVIAATGTLRGVAAAASFAILVYYFIANWAALRLVPADRLYPQAVPLLGFIICALLAVSLDLRVILTGIGVLTAGLLARTVVLWRRRQR